MLVLVLAGGVGGGCGGGSDRDGDLALYCDRLDALTSHDPFQAFGDRATPAEIEVAFEALLERTDELADAAPPEARAATDDYRAAARELDRLLAEVDYTTAVDPGAYGAAQVDYIEASQRLERFLESSC